jgi:hypothetical protein
MVGEGMRSVARQGVATHENGSRKRDEPDKDLHDVLHFFPSIVVLQIQLHYPDAPVVVVGPR